MSTKRRRSSSSSAAQVPFRSPPPSKKVARAVCVFVAGLKPDRMAAARDFCESHGALYTEKWIAGISHVVTTPKWLQSRDEVEALFVLAEASQTRFIVSYDWVKDCIAKDQFVRPSPHKHQVTNNVDIWQRAEEESHSLLAGHTLFFAGNYVFVEKQKDSRFASPKLSLCRQDLVLLAFLHGANVTDILQRENILIDSQHRGYTLDDLKKRVVPDKKKNIFHVIVPRRDAVSTLGLQIYETQSIRPVLSQWLIQCFQSQEVLSLEKFEVFN